MKYVLFVACIILSSLCANDARVSIATRRLPFEKQKQFEMSVLEQQKRHYTFNPLPPRVNPVGYHSLKSVSAIGDAFEIEDESVWIVDTTSYKTVLKWLQSDSIYITQNTNWFFYTAYKYKIVKFNPQENTKEFVYTNLHLGPKVKNPHTNLVKNIDYELGLITLTNQSRWQIDPEDNYILEDWKSDDGVIIGLNSNFSTKKFILINVSMNNFVRADIKK